MDSLILILPLFVGWILDLILGDPLWFPHPVVGFGKVIGKCEHSLNKGNHRQLLGGITAVVLILATFFATWTLLYITEFNLWLNLALQSVLIFCCLAGNTLVKEVRNVFLAVDKSLIAGRKQVARIVGRDTQNLSANEIRTAALETLAENLSDGVVAPLFWYALLGVPGMMAYKMINTLDSMIGYKTERYCQFGMVAAKLDDIANFIPARLTAFLMVLVTGRMRLLEFVIRFGSCHASPNSGYPEAALAGIINCRFGGTHDYFGESVYKPYIGTNPRQLNTTDMQNAISINRKVEVCMILLTVAIRFLFLI